MLRLAMLCTTALLAAACDQSQPPATAGDAALRGDVDVEIADASGKVVGLVHYDTGNPQALTIRSTGLPPGAHGIHLHEVGKCDPPKFESAGAHWNPANRQHGHENNKGPHAGDIGNLQVAANGTGKTEYIIPSGDHPNGLSLVIHANHDDDKTDPSGNSGARIACGVIFPAP